MITHADKGKKIAYACAYVPLVLIDAAGYIPYRILPISECPDQAGQLLHDNLCPHVKRILDWAIGKDLPDFAGIIFINSCDAMRRVCDAWRRVRPHRVAIIAFPCVYAESIPIRSAPRKLPAATTCSRALPEATSRWAPGVPEADHETIARLH